MSRFLIIEMQVAFRITLVRAVDHKLIRSEVPILLVRLRLNRDPDLRLKESPLEVCLIIAESEVPSLLVNILVT